MAKRVIDTTELPGGSIKAMANALGKLLGDEVYVRKVMEIESSEAVLKALDAVVEGAKVKARKPRAKE